LPGPGGTWTPGWIKKLFGSFIEGLVINAVLGFYLVAIIAEGCSLFIRASSVALCSSVFEYLRLLVLDIITWDSLSHPLYFFALPFFIHTGNCTGKRKRPTNPASLCGFIGRPLNYLVLGGSYLLNELDFDCVCNLAVLD
jgi:hypothetical protein